MPSNPPRMRWPRLQTGRRIYMQFERGSHQNPQTHPTGQLATKTKGGLSAGPCLRSWHLSAHTIPSCVRVRVCLPVKMLKVCFYKFYTGYRRSHRTHFWSIAVRFTVPSLESTHEQYQDTASMPSPLRILLAAQHHKQTHWQIHKQIPVWLSASHTVN
jgi:hypothetical protein